MQLLNQQKSEQKSIDLAVAKQAQEKQLDIAKFQLKQEVRPHEKSTKATVVKKRSINSKQAGAGNERGINKNSTQQTSSSVINKIPS